MSAAHNLGAGTLYMGGQPIGRIVSAEPLAAERLVQIFPLEPVSISFKFKSVWWNPMWRQIVSPPRAPKYRAPLRMCEARRFTPRRSYRR